MQYDLQHDFAWVTDNADRSVALALLQAANLGKRDDYKDWVHGLEAFQAGRCQLRSMLSELLKL